MTEDTSIPTDRVTFDGGTTDDQLAVLAVYHTFLHANDVMDYDELSSIWDTNSDNLYFNINGGTYEGLGDWENIWNYYRPQLRLLAPYDPGRVHVTIRGDMACLAADSVGRFKESLGPTPPENPRYYRATSALVRTDNGWKVVHAHFSTQLEGDRPDRATNAQ